METSYDVDPMGRVTRVTHQHAGGTATQNMPREKQVGGEESYSYSQAGVLTKLHPDTATRWADDVDTYGGTMPHQVGRTRFTYDKAGRVTQTVTKRLSKKPLVKHFYYDNGTQPVGYEDSDHLGVGWRYLYDGACRRVGKEQINTTTGEVTNRVMFLHEGDVLFGEYHTVNTMDPHVVGSARLWPADPGTGEILGQITINTTDSTAYRHDGGNGYYPGGNGGSTGADNSAGYPYIQHNNSHNNDPYNHNGSYNHNDSAIGDGAGGVLGWSQQCVDAVFYSMVCDLAGAPKELINPMTGEIVGYATYTLFGKRHWAGTVNTPLLFTGQYEDAESGWVYNRFRYYDPHAGVYNAQDPLGLLASTGTTQGYVTNPVIWVDVLGLKAHKRYKENVPDYLREVDDPLQKLVNNIMEKAKPGDVSRKTLGLGVLSKVRPDGSLKFKIVGATNGSDNSLAHNAFRQYFPKGIEGIRCLTYRMREVDGIIKPASAHAEETIINWAEKYGYNVEKIAASRYVCKRTCQPLLAARPDIDVPTPYQK